MSTLFTGCPLDGGRLAFDNIGAISHYFNGIPITVNDRIASESGTGASTIAGGVPVTSNGRVAIRGSTIQYYGPGALPIADVRRVAIANTGDPVSWNAGVPYTATGHIATTVLS